ncbi:MAG TPA: ATP-binding protein [Chryseolinea sp.]|nr:ATP-binding protein [Chryseolinea sp.]
MKVSTTQKLLFFSLITLFGNGFIGYTSYRNNKDLKDSESLVAHTEEVLRQTNRVLSLSKDLEIASHRFLMIDDTSLFESERLQRELQASVGQLRTLTKDNSFQQDHIDSLDYNMEQYIAFLFKSFDTKRNHRLTPATFISTIANHGKHLDRIHDAIADIQLAEATLLKERNRDRDQDAAVLNRISALMFIVMTISTIFLLFATGHYVLQNKEKVKSAEALDIANKELASQIVEMKRSKDELLIADKKLVYEDEQKGMREEELAIAKIELAFQDKEKRKRAAELEIASKELLFQTEEKEKRAWELNLADKELSYQNKEKEKRAEELVIANVELAFQNEQKERRAEELIIADKELSYQNEEKEKRAEELAIANVELAFQNEEKEKRAEELAVADKELEYQNEEKRKRAAELTIADKELVHQKKEKSKRAQELVIANRELIYQNQEKEKLASELTAANVELTYQNGEKEKRAAELLVANLELLYQNDEKEKRAGELAVANKELESFSYSVSHDLRAPLRSVHGFARILKDDYGTHMDAEANRVIDKIVKNAKKMGKLLDDLLTFSRLGKKELNKLTIDMHSLVTMLCNETQSEQPGHTTLFMINDLHHALGDSNAIKQAWVNLISNAVKYSKLNEKALIEIGSSMDADEIIYFIKDNGAGFDMRYADKLFGVFQRMHTDDKFEGTGVGLAIVHRIISKHGGRVWAEGKVNEGATFYFSLPKNN